jgi:sec-independent protein translocase protein TatB
MFDISFLELVVVGIVGLLVLGPERLPGAIRTGSLYVGRLKRGFNKLRFEIEDEINATEIRTKLKNDAIYRIDDDLTALKQNLYQAINNETDASTEIATGDNSRSANNEVREL